MLTLPRQCLIRFGDYKQKDWDVNALSRHSPLILLNHVSLLITETDDRCLDPQTLARVSIRGIAEILPRNDPGYAQVKQNYLGRFPKAERLFSLGDFNLWKITPKGERYVAGFGRAFNLVLEGLLKVSAYDLSAKI